MKFFEMIFFIVSLMLVLKIVVFIVKSLTNFQDDKISFAVKVKKEHLDKLTSLEFEGFCKWLFENTGQYKSVEITPPSNDKGHDLILTTLNDETIFVECKRFDEDTETEDFIIGRVICQKLIGAMASSNVKKGIIITTGKIHQNAIDYIEELRKNSLYEIDILTTVDILTLLEYNKNKEDYTITATI